jgi:hypothetical protein
MGDGLESDVGDRPAMSASRTNCSSATTTSEKAGNSAKYWLQPVALARNVGYSAVELRQIEAKVAAEAVAFLEAGRVRFG